MHENNLAFEAKNVLIHSKYSQRFHFKHLNKHFFKIKILLKKKGMT